MKRFKFFKPFSFFSLFILVLRDYVVYFFRCEWNLLIYHRNFLTYTHTRIILSYIHTLAKYDKYPHDLDKVDLLPEELSLRNENKFPCSSLPSLQSCTGVSHPTETVRISPGRSEETNFLYWWKFAFVITRFYRSWTFRSSF